MLLSRLLAPFIRVGRLTVVDAEGRAHVFGTDPQPHVTIRLHDPGLHWRLALSAERVAGEAYADGTLTVEDASLYEFLDLIGRNYAVSGYRALEGPLDRLRFSLRRLRQFNPVRRARRNAAHHYNHPIDFYRLFLDRDLQYSCAYFTEGEDDLDRAQARKQALVAAKLLLEPGMHVLDIGCGWGGLALSLAGLQGVHVTGITLAEEQLRIARERAAAGRMGDRVQFHLRDYREEAGTYDRVVSVGMFEHVGINHYRTFFGAIRDRLTDDGIALVHTIGRALGPGNTNTWLHKHVFPGGYAPALSEVVPAIEQAGLWITDIEVLRLHYAETLRHWRERFLSRRNDVLRLYDERFCRLWEFFLASCEMAFRHLDCVVFQIQLARRRDAVPLTRAYLLRAGATVGAEIGPEFQAPSTVGSGRRRAL